MENHAEKHDEKKNKYCNNNNVINIYFGMGVEEIELFVMYQNLKLVEEKKNKANYGYLNCIRLNYTMSEIKFFLMSTKFYVFSSLYQFLFFREFSF